MELIIALLLAPLVYATCDYPSGVGTWHPKAGQTFGLVMWELGITDQVIEALNPATDIDRIYPEFPYNVTIKKPRTGKWIAGCPLSLMIDDAEDSSPIDSTTEQLGTPELTPTSGIDKHEQRSTRTISTTTTIYRSEGGISTARPNTFASSVATHDKVTGPLTPSDLTTGTIVTETTDNLSVDGQGRGTATEVPTSVPSSVTDTARSETTASSTSSATCALPQTKGDGDTKMEKPTGTSLAKEQPVSSGDNSARRLSDGASMGLTTPLTTDDAITTSIPSPSQISTGSTTVSKGAALAKSTSTQAKSANTDAASDQIVPSPHAVSTRTRTRTTEVVISSYTVSADQTGKEAKSALTETETTFVTSPSKAASETTTTANSYDREAVRLATCLYDPDLVGLGETDSDKVWSLINSLCDVSYDGLSMRTGDKCQITEMATTYASRVNYLFEICQKEDCPSGSQSMTQPFGMNGLSCIYIFYHKIWHGCKFPNPYQDHYLNSFTGNEINHHGNGGSFKIGCLEYSLEIG